MLKTFKSVLILPNSIIGFGNYFLSYFIFVCINMKILLDSESEEPKHLMS